VRQDLRFHDLRYTCATLHLGEGVNVKVVSGLLGQASITITLNVYYHVLPDTQDSADAMDLDHPSTSGRSAYLWGYWRIGGVLVSVAHFRVPARLHYVCSKLSRAILKLRAGKSFRCARRP
jgi:hypothetical protein